MNWLRNTDSERYFFLQTLEVKRQQYDSLYASLSQRFEKVDGIHFSNDVDKFEEIYMTLTAFDFCLRYFRDKEFVINRFNELHIFEFIDEVSLIYGSHGPVYIGADIILILKSGYDCSERLDTLRFNKFMNGLEDDYMTIRRRHELSYIVLDDVIKKVGVCNLKGSVGLLLKEYATEYENITDQAEICNRTDFHNGVFIASEEDKNHIKSLCKEDIAKAEKQVASIRKR